DWFTIETIPHRTLLPMVELREAYFVRQCRLDHLHIPYSVRFQIRLQRLQRRLGGFYSHDCLVVFAGLKCPEATVCACVNEQLPICKNSVSAEVLSMIEDSVEGHNEPVLPFTVMMCLATMNRQSINVDLSP